MQKGFVNAAFALFAVLLLVGSSLAAPMYVGPPASSGNKAPVITGVAGPSSLSVGEAGTWKVSAYDPDGNYLSYSVVWGDEGALKSAADSSQTGSTATFQHTYPSAGTYTITFTVKDSAGAQTQSSITTRVVGASANRPPVFSAVSCPVTGQSVTCYVYATDPDSDPVTYTLSFGDGTAKVSGMQNAFVHTYTNAGTYTVSIEAKDKYNASTGTALQVKLTGNENQKPIISSVSGPSSLSVGEAGTWKVSAYDPDGNYLSYSVVWGDEGTLKSAADSSQTGSTATFQHTYYKAGTYTITFTVTDDKGAKTQSTLTVRVAGSTPSPSGPLDLQVELLSSDCYKYNGNAVVCGPAIDMTTYNGNMFVVSDAGYQASRLLAVLNPGTADYLFLYKLPGYDYFSVAQHFYMTDKDQFNVEKLLSDTYKYENGGIVTGVSLEFTAQSGYAIVAYTPSGVRYETSRLLAVIDSQGGEFRHLFKQAGNDYFTTARRFYTSQASIETDKVTASVGATPTELYQYDSVYVAGKVGRPADSNTGAQKYIVVLAFDNGGAIPKVYSGNVNSQMRVEEITLAPGESKEVSAYFTANKLGTNFATIAVYASESGGYGLVASDTAKVHVKESGIPSPPNESITIVLEKGWNQISVPAFSLQVEELADACDISQNVWAYDAANKQYVKATTLGGGHVGFWVKAYSECKYTIDEPYLTPAPYAFNLKAGWNMIGAPLSATAISSFAGNCKITSGPWNYSPAAGQYGYSSELAPGKGYWVKVAYDCTLGGSDMPPSAPAETRPAAVSKDGASN